MEAALKFARRFGYNEAPGDHAGFIACDGSFHGRTFGALSVTSREAYRTPFTPLVPGIAFLPYNASDDEIEQIVDQQVGAVIIEPVQGEGGLHVATPEFLRAVRLRCNQIGALLIFDEIQSGLGRTGQIWAHEQLGVMPNMMTIAKPLGGGLPIGAVLLDDVAAEALSYGDHGSTFGANPFVCAVANKVVETITEPGFLLHVQSVGAELGTGLRSLQEKHSIIKEVRGRGLMWGIDCGATLVAPLVEAAFAAGLLVASAGPNVIRIVPPLIITAEEVQTLIQRLDQAFKPGRGIKKGRHRRPENLFFVIDCHINWCGSFFFGFKRRIVDCIALE